MSVATSYKDGRWHQRRTEIFTRDKFACVICGSTIDIQCHHHWYVGNREIWEYDDDELSTLCRSHHELLTEAQGMMRRNLCKVGPSRFVQIARTILEQEEATQCVGIKLVATRDQTHKFRLYRLKSLISDLMGDPTAPLNVISRLTDDKGTLWVDWKMFYTSHQQDAVGRAWKALGESEVKHTEAF